MIKEDPDVTCGTGVLSTGAWDPHQPACEKHDAEFDDKWKDVAHREPFSEVQAEFAGNLLKDDVTLAGSAAAEVAKLAFAVVTTPIYWTAATVVGGIRWLLIPGSRPKE